jgi:hypothetical protein
VPARTVENERDVLVVGDRLCECFEKRLHSNVVCVGQDERERIVGAGLDRGVDVGIRVALIDEAGRALAALPPNMADAPLLPDAGLILKIKTQALVFMRTLNFLQRSSGSF